MIRKLQIILIFSLFTFHFSLFTFASSVDNVVSELQKKYSGIQDMKGKFSQKSYLKDLEKVETYEGEFFIKKPFSMRWKYSKPRDEEVIIRDSGTWVYKESEKQAFKTAFNKDSYNQVPIALLSSLGDLTADFDITMIKEGTLELKPKRTMGYINTVYIDVVSRDFPVKTLTLLDVYGNKIVIEMKNVKLNTGLEDSFFTFKLPPGTEVFDLSQ